jgi:hypothetical protein
MKTVLEYVTPEIARKYLATVDPQKQRLLGMSRVMAFAREMKAGHWMLNHQGFAFDEDGNLIDGQHRCKAIEICGLTIPVLVTRGVVSTMVNGVKLHAFDAIDIGYKRKMHESLAKRHGIQNSARVAAACRGVLIWATGIDKCAIGSALEILKIYPDIKRLASESNKYRHLTGAVIAALAIAIKNFPKLEGEFAQPFITGANLRQGSPSLTLRNHLLNNSGIRMHSVLALTLSCLKAAALNQRMFRVAYNNEGVAFFANLQKGNTQKIRQAVGLFEETTLTNNQRKETTNEPNHQ